MSNLINIRKLVLCLSIILASPLIAALTTFDVAEGNWNISGNWSIGIVPGTADMPIIPLGRKVTIDSDVLECNNVFCGQSSGNPQKGTMLMRSGGKLTTSILLLGRDENNHGIYNQSGGELIINSYLSIGDNDGGAGGTASGELNLSAGNLKMSGTAAAYVGNKGKGEMVVAGAGTFFANDLIIGNAAGSENSVFYQCGGTTFIDNLTVGGAATSDGNCEISGGLFVWSNLFIVRDTLTIKGELSSIKGVQSGGTSLQLENSSVLQFIFDANGMSPILIDNSEISISSAAKIEIDGTFYSRNAGVAKSFLLVKHNGYADQTTFASGNVKFSGFGNFTPMLRYESNEIYLDLTVSGNDFRQGQGIFLKYWELPINDDAPWNRGYQKIVSPLSSVPVFTNELVRTHPTFGKRVKAINLSEVLSLENIFVQFKGYIKIPTSGSYTFYLNSDDGSKLWIDGILLVNNDGTKSSPTEVSAATTLSPGLHEIEVGFFHNTGTPVLEASWSGPGISKEEIPEEVLYIFEFPEAFSSLYSFKRIIPDAELIYNYCPSFMYDDVEGLYKIWSGGSAVGDDYIIYKESATLEGLLDAEIQYALSPSHNPAKFDDVHACDPNVFNVSGTFYLSYSGNTDGSVLPATTRIGMAISYDRGRTFQRLHNGEHILAPAPDFTFDPNNYGVGQSAVVRAKDGYWYMIYTDVDNFRTGQKTFIRVIRCSDPAFPTNKHEMINSNVPEAGGVSLDLVYNSSNEQFIVIANVCDDPNLVENPLVKIRLSYYDKDWNYIRSRQIKADTSWAFGEGIAMLSDLRKYPLNYSENGLDSYVFAAATSEYKTNTTLWAYWVAGDTKYIVVPEETEQSGLKFDDGIFSYIQNSDVKLGVITNYGAIIGYFSEITPEENFVNYMSAGRGVQQSYSGNQDEVWKWNAVQGGSYTNAKPKLLVFSNENNKIYAKLNPRNWATGELLTDVVMEEWISLTGNIAQITFKMSYTGATDHVLENQKIPSAFFNSINNKLTYYNGVMAWTKGELESLIPPEFQNQDVRQEQWAAFVRDSGHGIGLYTPEYSLMDFYKIDGNGGDKSNACSQISAIKNMAITNNFSCQYDVYLTIGMTNEIRENFDIIRKSKFKYEPLPALKNPGFELPYIPSGMTNVVHDWNCGGQNKIQRGGAIAPANGQVAWYNGAGYLAQSLLGAKLQPDTTYQLTFDAYTIAGWSPKTIHAGIMFGNNNNTLAVIQNTNVENFVMSSGSWLGTGWAGGGLFNTISNPAANNSAITHTLMFDTPVSNIFGNNLLDDLTIDIWDSSGIQVQVDNVSITNYPRNRSMLPKVSNGTFDSPATIINTATNVINNWNNINCGIINAAVVAPLSGQCAYFNAVDGCVQTFPGVKLQPDMNYRITFDSYSMPSWDLRTIKVGLIHARYFGGESRFICPLDDDNVINVNQGSGVWLGNGWASGALFSNVWNPSTDDPAISHIFSFSTPETLAGDYLAFDLGVKLWGTEGPQVKLDNLIITNFAIPEGSLVFSILFSVFAMWRKLYESTL